MNNFIKKTLDDLRGAFNDYRYMIHINKREIRRRREYSRYGHFNSYLFEKVQRKFFQKFCQMYENIISDRVDLLRIARRKRTLYRFKGSMQITKSEIKKWLKVGDHTMFTYLKKKSRQRYPVEMASEISSFFDDNVPFFRKQIWRPR